MKQKNEIGRVFGLGALSFVIGITLRINATLMIGGVSSSAIYSGSRASMHWADTWAILSPWFMGLGIAWMVLSSSFSMLQSIRKD